MGIKEAVVEQYLVKRVKELGGIAYKFVSPGRRSVPDRLCVLPNMVLFVECKAEGGTLTTGQDREIKRLHDLGMSVVVVYSKTDVDTIIGSIKAAYVKREEQ